jgi:hypothetical protein
MLNPGYRNETPVRVLFFLALLLLSEPLYPQYAHQKDTSIKVSKGSFILLKEKNAFVSKDTIIKITGTLVPASISRKNKTMAFYDSLKAKASKSNVTRALFDLVIVSPDTLNKKRIINRSDESFRDYSGIRIRKIHIQRLNAFGSNVDNPGYYHPNGIEKVLNSTHINTNENIVRKNLLFNEGDTISPLKLTDNERILRQLSFINDARIIVIPVSDAEADILVITKDVYSLGGDLTYRGIGKGSVWLFDKNIFGMGHEFKLEVPYSSNNPDSPGIGLSYCINNIWKTFVNLNVNYYNGLGKRTYGFTLARNLVSSETKYAGGISIRQMYTTEDLDTLPKPEPLAWNYQDYWLLRSFLINRESVTRIILGIRYINNNVFERPFIKPDTYYALQKYRIYLGSVTFSRQKYYKANLIYNYGRTEDIPYGGLIRFTGGMEDNELSKRGYLGTDVAIGKSIPVLGYFYGSAGFGAFFTDNNAKQGVLSVALKYFSNLIPLGRQRIRNFINIDYTRGFDRNADEYLAVLKNNGFTGFSNDSLRGTQRLKISLESVAFTPLNTIGFRFAVFGFADMALLAGPREMISNGRILSCIGLGIRIRNDNLVFNTFQIKFGFFFNPPAYSRISYITVSGEQLLTPNNFDPGPPSPLPYR